MRAILHDLNRWLTAGESIALATVVRTEGSSPRPLGSRMAVTESGRMTGSVSGGCVEGDVFRAARRVLSQGKATRLRYEAVDESGWQVGLACGGAIDVYVEPLLDVHRRLLDALQKGETVGLATHLGNDGHLLAWPDGRLHGNRSLASELTAFLGTSQFPAPAAELRHTGEADVLLEVFARPATLNVVGAVHIAVPVSYTHLRAHET